MPGSRRSDRDLSPGFQTGSRGRGRGRGRGQGRGRGRGNGRGYGRGRYSARGASKGHIGRLGEDESIIFEGDFEDFTLDRVAIPQRPSRNASPARGRGGYKPSLPRPSRGLDTRRMRGIGFTSSRSRPSTVSLADLDRDRPFLRPIKFVRGENQKTLFQEVEELLHVPGENYTTIDDHAPSAGVVERIFEANKITDEGELSTNHHKEIVSISKDGDPDVSTTTGEGTVPSFVIDTAPSPVTLPLQSQSTANNFPPIGSIPLEVGIVEEEIVYVAPNPRTGQSSPAISSLCPTPEPLPNIDIPSANSVTSDLQSTSATVVDFPSVEVPPGTDRYQDYESQVDPQTKHGYNVAPILRKIERAVVRRRAERESMLAKAGLDSAANESKTLRRGSIKAADPRKLERRRGDSDVDWGTDSDSEVEDLQGDMGLDPEIPDIEHFVRFARGVAGLNAGEVVTIADLEDAVRMKEEDEEDGEEGTSEQDDSVFNAEERKVVGETSDSETSESSEVSAMGSFQARLHRIREISKGRHIKRAEIPSSEEENSEDDAALDTDPWKGNHILDRIEHMLEENEDILYGRDRKARKKIFNIIRNGEFMDDFNTRKKDRVVPMHLREQWERDRAKKAERKRRRAQERLTAEFHMRKSMKKTFSSARFQGDVLIIDHVADMAALEEQIRTFLHNLELRKMILPPKDREWRKRAHLLAHAFNLKSDSKGKGDGRFTTLSKTTRSGLVVDERKVLRLVNGSGCDSSQTLSRTRKVLRNREGDEVGKTAPKLSETNIGFKLLRQMGWEEGNRIGGVTGGLLDPLTAIIKTSKLGLGASR